jgi:hypothetical protein
VRAKRLVIVGATGMVGGYALRYALDDPDVGAVTAIGRRKVGISHPKLKEVLHPNFADCSALAVPLAGQDAVVFCLGTYTGVVTEAEALLASRFSRVYVFRPAYIYPVEPRSEPTFSYRLLRGIYPAFRALFPNQVVRADDLGRVMVNAAVDGTPKREGPVFENRDIRSMVASVPPATE